ncbi:metallophosphoesterase [Helcobacillus massiliensis]|uniref:Calcineurin-like phosphoesterase domain-containing protein n=1 Tax=Helcobacillus massiliensis TaxID=521392 RepID=A0A839QU73_9MICO|nr:metallophosphoesterase [Helcobacillus massiliensis]MBB3023188.1 hypothetical protein [Helcobacillus massiliensis]
MTGLPLSRSPLGIAATAVGAAGFAVAAGAHVWARHIEPNLFEVRELSLPVLPTGAGRLRVLHISDIHLAVGQERKIEFLRYLATMKPDLVVNTGDNVSSAAAIPVLLDALGPLLERPGVFVNGSNDKYAAGKRNVFRYFLPDPREEGGPKDPPLPTEQMTDAFTAAGWLDLNNARGTLQMSGCDVDFVGVDDPHLDHDEFPAPDGRGDSVGQPSPAGDVAAQGRPRLRVGVMHAPYQRVIREMVEDGSDVLFAGHTHGGQLALPWFGALVTNCDLHRSQAKGVSMHHGVPLHVSGGLGANPFYNMRMFNRPEATLLTLKQRRA